jgi:hypothetical protein
MVEVIGVDIERPKTVFGKNPYIKEQWDIYRFVDFATRGVALINPKAVGVDILEPVINRLPIERRIRKIRESFEQARRKLNDLGV